MIEYTEPEIGYNLSMSILSSKLLELESPVTVLSKEILFL